MCTTNAESPWSNGPTETQNAVLSVTMTKTIKYTQCDLEFAVDWAIGAKNSFNSNNGFSPDQLFVHRSKSASSFRKAHVLSSET